MPHSPRPLSPRHLRLVSLIVAVAALGLLGCSGPSPETAPQVAANFTLPRVDGGSVNLADHSGKVVLLDFWATWCPPCRAAMPHLVKLQEEYRADGLVVLGMNMDKNPEDLDQFLAIHTVNYPMLQVDDATRGAYGGVASIPQTFLIDRSGMVRHKFMGYDHKISAQIDQSIRDLLLESP